MMRAYQMRIQVQAGAEWRVLNSDAIGCYVVHGRHPGIKVVHEFPSILGFSFHLYFSVVKPLLYSALSYAMWHADDKARRYARIRNAKDKQFFGLAGVRKLPRKLEGSNDRDTIGPSNATGRTMKKFLVVC
jgi:hypothetical protein